MSLDKKVWSDTQKSDFEKKWENREKAGWALQANSHDPYNVSNYETQDESLLAFVKDLVKKNIWPDSSDLSKYISYFEYAQRKVAEDEKRKNDERLKLTSQDIPAHAKEKFQQITKLKREIKEKETENLKTINSIIKL